jgi:hypothetical protein
MALARLDRLSEAQAAAVLALNRRKLLEVIGHYQIPALQVNRERTREFKPG